MKKVGWVFIRIFLFYCLFLFSSLCSMSQQNIKALAVETFGSQMPGLESTIVSQNYGKWFELASALCAREFLGEDVIGFGLTINILNPEQKVRVPDLDGEDDFLELRTTEFDVVTDNYVFECKNSAKPKNFYQFRKEQDTLSFFRNLQKDIENDDLKMLEVMKIEKGKKRNRIINVLTINGLCTGWKDVSISSSWVDGFIPEICEKQWLEIIETLSAKKLLAVFRTEVPPVICLELNDMGIEYKDKLDDFFDNVVFVEDEYDSDDSMADC